jgi:hypothetical protein
MTRYYLDTEFDDTGTAINLISIGLVCEDGRELYLGNSECNHDTCNDWVKANVLPQLPKRDAVIVDTRPDVYGITPIDRFKGSIWRTRVEIRDAINAFIVDDGQPVEIWAYFASCDWVVFYQLFGEMVNLPKRFPRFVRDLKTYALDIGYTGKFKVLVPDEGHHDALCDARWNRNVHRTLIEMHNRAYIVLVDALLADLNDRAGFDVDSDVRDMIRPDWIKIVEGSMPFGQTNYEKGGLLDQKHRSEP